MYIYIIHSNDIYTFRLPNEVSGSYMLNDFDVNGKTRSLINISADTGKWFLNANEDVSILSQGTPVDKVEVSPYNFYTLKYYDKEYILLYVFPGFDTGYVVKQLASDSITIGTKSSCDIVYTNTNISEKQIHLERKNGVWTLTNMCKKVPVYVNRKRREKIIISAFDSIFIMGLRFKVLGDKIIISHPPNSLHFINERVVDATFEYVVDNNPTKEVSKEFYTIYDYFFKSPTFKKKYDEYNCVITPPDAKEKSSGNNIISEIVPSALMSVTSLVSLYFSISNYKSTSIAATPENIAQNKETLITSALMCAVMLVTGIAWPIVEFFASKIKFFMLARMRVFNYKRYLKRKDKELKNIISEEKNVLQFNNFSLEECQKAIFTKNANLFSRNIESDSFLKIKCGNGKVKSSIVFEYTRPDMIVQNDRLFDDIDKLMAKYEYIDSASFVAPLKNTSLAVIDPSGEYSDFLNSLILQLICLHDYGSLKLVVLTDESSPLNCIKNLNHCWNNERTVRYFATNLHEAENLSTELMRICNKLNPEETSKPNIETYYVIVSDCVEKYKSLKIVDYILRSRHNDEINKCMSLLMFADKVTSIPTGCEYFINYSAKEASFFSSEMDEKSITKFVPSCINENIDFYGCVQALSNIPIQVNSVSSTTGSLPTKLGFLEMYGVGKIDQLNIVERWKSASISSTLAAPVGVDANGNILNLDLHEKKHGPHGLVAGMTGSGKSEFIVTYILSLAINYSPDEVQFVLIDYKGGGLAGAFENRKTGIKLPHLVGTITNLDKAEMNRTLVSIKSELQRRQRVFNYAKEKLNTGSIDIYKYQMLVRDGSLDEPMSHLFIFCDEFAELKAQQPDFMDELVSAARIGRSLGIHLILATQKPSGVVDEQIWANSKFKVCCKVQTADDSNEMLRKPDAAYIKESGRFYLQVGYDEYYVLGQSGYSGVQYVPSEFVVTNTDNSISFINNFGEIYRNVTKKVEEDENAKSENYGEELNNILRYIVDVANKNGYSYHQLWLENVPKKLYYGNLVKKYSDIKAQKNVINPIIGEYDDPENQSQGCIQLPITGAGNTVVIGNSGSGKGTLFSSLIFSSIINHTNDELNLYVLDFGSEKFNGFKNAPHVGDVLTINDKNKINYFFYMIDREVKKRQKFYSDNGGDFALDIQNGKLNFPNIVVLLYGLEVFKDTFDELYDGLFASITRLCSKVGIEFIIAASSSDAISYTLENNFKQKVLLQLTDESDYSFVFKGGHAPSKNPGRGLILHEGFPVEFQVALICEEGKQKEYLDSVFSQLNSAMKGKAPAVPEVPKKVSLSSYIPLIKSLDNIPIGVNVLTAQQESFDFSNTVSLFSASETKNINKFMSKFSTLIANCPNNNLIILNADKGFTGKLDEKGKCYSQDFQKIVNVLYTNCEKLNSAPSDKMFTILVIGYASLNSSLKKLHEKDETIHTLDDLIMITKNKSFKYLLYDKEERFEHILNSDFADMVDNSNGIWIGVDYDGQSSFEMQSMSSNESINPSNELAVIVRDSEPIITRFPTVS